MTTPNRNYNEMNERSLAQDGAIEALNQNMMEIDADIATALQNSGGSGGASVNNGKLQLDTDSGQVSVYGAVSKQTTTFDYSNPAPDSSSWSSLTYAGEGSASADSDLSVDGNGNLVITTPSTQDQYLYTADHQEIPWTGSSTITIDLQGSPLLGIGYADSDGLRQPVEAVVIDKSGEGGMVVGGFAGSGDSAPTPYNFTGEVELEITRTESEFSVTATELSSGNSTTATVQSRATKPSNPRIVFVTAPSSTITVSPFDVVSQSALSTIPSSSLPTIPSSSLPFDKPDIATYIDNNRDYITPTTVSNYSVPVSNDTVSYNGEQYSRTLYVTQQSDFPLSDGDEITVPHDRVVIMGSVDISKPLRIVGVGNFTLVGGTRDSTLYFQQNGGSCIKAKYDNVSSINFDSIDVNTYDAQLFDVPSDKPDGFREDKSITARVLEEVNAQGATSPELSNFTVYVSQNPTYYTRYVVMAENSNGNPVYLSNSDATLPQNTPGIISALRNSTRRSIVELATSLLLEYDGLLKSDNPPNSSLTATQSGPSSLTLTVSADYTLNSNATSQLSSYGDGRDNCKFVELPDSSSPKGIVVASHTGESAYWVLTQIGEFTKVRPESIDRAIENVDNVFTDPSNADTTLSNATSVDLTTFGVPDELYTDTDVTFEESKPLFDSVSAPTNNWQLYRRDKGYVSNGNSIGGLFLLAENASGDIISLNPVDGTVSVNPNVNNMLDIHPDNDAISNIEQRLNDFNNRSSVPTEETPADTATYTLEPNSLTTPWILTGATNEGIVGYTRKDGNGNREYKAVVNDNGTTKYVQGDETLGTSEYIFTSFSSFHSAFTGGYAVITNGKTPTVDGFVEPYAVDLNIYDSTFSTELYGFPMFYNVTMSGTHTGGRNSTVVINAEKLTVTDTTLDSSLYVDVNTLKMADVSIPNKFSNPPLYTRPPVTDVTVRNINKQYSGEQRLNSADFNWGPRESVNISNVDYLNTEIQSYDASTGEAFRMRRLFSTDVDKVKINTNGENNTALPPDSLWSEKVGKVTIANTGSGIIVMDSQSNIGPEQERTFVYENGSWVEETDVSVREITPDNTGDDITFTIGSSDAILINPDGSNTVLFGPDPTGFREGNTITFKHNGGSNTPVVSFNSSVFAGTGPSNLTTAGSTATIQYLGGEWTVVNEYSA